jgi:RNA polymerase sigma factor for flagellar operon FliA
LLFIIIITIAWGEVAMDGQVRTSAQWGKSDEAELWERYHSLSPRSEERRKIQEEIISRYQYLVRFVVRRMNVTPPRELDYEDLLSYGSMGLLDAIDRFDPSLGFTFQTYAASRIRGMVLDELRRFDWISRSGREKIQALERAMESELQETGKLDGERIKKRLGVSDEQLKEMMEIANRSFVGCLDELVALEDTEVEKADILADDRPGPDDLAFLSDEIERLHGALDVLSDREKRLVELYYFRYRNFREIADEFGLSESRISQLHKRVLDKLRKVLSGNMETA